MPRYSQPFKLSDRGSNRATAYCYTNKIITLKDKTHVVWTDAIAETRGRTFDHVTRQWGETIEIGSGVDNHNNPSITADRDGRIHIAFGPHGGWANYPAAWPAGAFKHSIAPDPNSLVGLGTKNGVVGYNGTYAYLLHDAAGFDCLVYRGGEGPPSLMFQRQTRAGGWSSARELMAQDIPPGYTHMGPSVLSDRQGVLYVAGHFYSSFRGTSVGVAILKSVDAGANWTDLTGRPVITPTQYDPRLAVPHPIAEHDPRNWGLALDSANRLWAMSGKQGATGRHLPLSRWTGSGWETVDVGKFLPADRIPSDGSMTIDTQDRIHLAVAANLAPADPGDKPTRGWGDPSSEVFHLCSRDGGKSFSCNQVSPSDPAVAHWLPLLPHGGPFHPVEKLTILYTRGESTAKPGEGCNASGHTDVYAVHVESLD